MSATETSKTPPALDWGDPVAVNTWALDVYTQARDATGAGEDATRPPGQRELGRAAARRIIDGARRKLDDALRFAGLDIGKGAP